MKPKHAKQPGTRTIWKNMVALSLGIVLSLICAEVVSRIFVPIFPGAQKLGLNGERLSIDSVQPGAVYRQYSEEYDALTTITEEGYRIPKGGDNPSIIFLGDSFTFGQGLGDEQTFPFLYCQTLDVSCANLGVPGASTISELDRLERFLVNEKWRPQQVWLFVFAMTQFLGAGNDLYDNIQTVQQKKKLSLTIHSHSHSASIPFIKVPHHSLSDFFYFLLDFRTALLQHSNLARVMKFYFGNRIKRFVAPEANEEALTYALSLMKEQLKRFGKLAEQFNFSPSIFLIHPLQDMLRGTDHLTMTTLQPLTPMTIHSTAHLFLEKPELYYFPLDGHLNEQGSKRIAAFLLSQFSNSGKE